MRRVIGLTGSIATGKSTVAKMFLEEGIYVIDSDILAKETLKESHIIEQIEHSFGVESVNLGGQVDRAYLANVIFCNYDKRMQLNDIIHPHVEAKIQELLEKRRNSFVVVDVPLMYETKFHELMEEIIVVYAPYSVQLHRLMERNHYSQQEAESRIQSQLSIEQKVKLADYVIDNSSSKVQLYKNFQKLLREMQGD